MDYGYFVLRWSLALLDATHSAVERSTVDGVLRVRKHNSIGGREIFNKPAAVR